MPEPIVKPTVKEVLKNPPGQIKPPPKMALDQQFDIQQLPPIDDYVPGSDDLKEDVGTVIPKRVEAKDIIVEKKEKEDETEDILEKPDDETVVEDLEQKEEKSEDEELETKPDAKDEDLDLDSILLPEEGKEVVKKEPKDEKEKKAQQTKDASAFDYSGFDESERRHLKNMDKNAREFVSGLIKKEKSLRDSSYLQDPNAYLLSPEYQQIDRGFKQTSFEAKFFGEQLALAKAGKPYKKLLGYDKNGNPVVDDKDTIPTDQDEEELRLSVSSARQLCGQFQGRATQLKQNYHQRIEQDRQQAMEFRKSKFPWIADPSMQGRSLNVKGFGPRKISQIRQDIIDQYPVWERNSMGAQTSGDLFVALMIRDAMLDKLKGTKQMKQVKEEEAQLAEPRSITRPPAAKKNGVGRHMNFDSKGMPDLNP